MKEEKSEFGLIDWIRGQRKGRGAEIVTDIGDDMAVMQLGEERVLITTDMLLEGVHFDLQRAVLEEIGYKAMGCSLSDCAAMAAVPVAAVAAVALREGMSMEQAQQLYKGMGGAAERYSCPIVGGDTTSWNEKLVVNITMLAKPGARKPVLRSGAQVGDVIMVTGELGGAIEWKHLNFTPRVNEALLLTEMADVHAMIDVSDGLSSDLGHICQESKVSAEIEAEKIPVSEAAQNKDNPLEAALNDGEDFELLFCVSKEDGERLMQEWGNKSATRLSIIGKIEKDSGEHKMYIRQADGRREVLESKGWEHFSR